jgi:hypothetical protein
VGSRLQIHESKYESVARFRIHTPWKRSLNLCNALQPTPFLSHGQLKRILRELTLIDVIWELPFDLPQILFVVGVPHTISFRDL